MGILLSMAENFDVKELEILLEEPTIKFLLRLLMMQTSAINGKVEARPRPTFADNYTPFGAKGTRVKENRDL